MAQPGVGRGHGRSSPFPAGTERDCPAGSSSGIARRDHPAGSSSRSAGSEARLAGEAGTPPGRDETPLDRTLSFIRRMTGKTKGKDKDRMKEGKDKDARYTNGHLFTTISVSGMTMCFACNKSITAKEALVCPTCNVTIHNRCKDTLPNCTKVKQKQQKAALLKNSSALQSVSLRNKSEWGPFPTFLNLSKPPQP
ncbi:rho guanine nucleotide exchange factor 2-like, partial [Empidonax traillii]|uniref:rho guanine nucleotide exchange factor 2-like n=1 Tax=Empidonax traillii TaxID=164674 RepID=UPI000FFD789A